MRITKRKLNSIISKIIIEEAARKGQSLKLSKRQLRRILAEAVDENFESDIGAENLDALNPEVANAQSKGDVKSSVKNVKIRPGDNSEVYRYVTTKEEYEGEESNIVDKYYYALNDKGNFIASKTYDPNTGKAKRWLSLKKYPGSLKKLKDALDNYLNYEDYILNLPDDAETFDDPSQYPILMYVGTAGVSADLDPTRGEESDQEAVYTPPGTGKDLTAEGSAFKVGDIIALCYFNELYGNLEEEAEQNYGPDSIINISNRGQVKYYVHLKDDTGKSIIKKAISNSAVESGSPPQSWSNLGANELQALNNADNSSVVAPSDIRRDNQTDAGKFLDLSRAAAKTEDTDKKLSNAKKFSSNGVTFYCVLEKNYDADELNITL